MRFSKFLIFSTLIIAILVGIGFGLASDAFNEALPNTVKSFPGKVLSATEQNFGVDIINKETEEASSATTELIGGLPVSEEKNIIPKVQYDLGASCGTVMNLQDGNLLFEKDADRVWPIASITKLMTALVFLDYNPGWDTIYEIKRNDRREGGKIYLYMGEKVKVRDLFYLSLIGSDNTATIALINSTGITEAEFVKKMNERVDELGLIKTNFYDATGLSSANVSTAREVAKFSQIALSSEEISSATLKKEYEFYTLEGKKKIVFNTDNLLNNFPQNGIKILGGKTGYTESAGYCFVGRFINHEGQDIISVVLGSDNDSSRFTQTKELMECVYDGLANN